MTPANTSRLPGHRGVARPLTTPCVELRSPSAMVNNVPLSADPLNLQVPPADAQALVVGIRHANHRVIPLARRRTGLAPLPTDSDCSRCGGGLVGIGRADHAEAKRHGRPRPRPPQFGPRCGPPLERPNNSWTQSGNRAGYSDSATLDSNAAGPGAFSAITSSGRSCREPS